MLVTSTIFQHLKLQSQELRQGLLCQFKGRGEIRGAARSWGPLEFFLGYILNWGVSCREMSEKKTGERWC